MSVEGDFMDRALNLVGYIYGTDYEKSQLASIVYTPKFNFHFETFLKPITSSDVGRKVFQI